MDALLLDVRYQKVENRVGAELGEGFRVPLFETRPGRDIGVPSFTPE
jgi:hypothetical protein